MKRKFKVLKWLISVLLLIIIGFVANILISTGFFREIENTSIEQTLKSISLDGAEDIMVSYEDSFAIISATDRSVFPAHEQELGGLYFMNLKNQNYELQALTMNLEIPFAPHGISMMKVDSIYHIRAINHTLDGDFVELFELNKTDLKHVNTLPMDDAFSPNDLVMIDKERFYMTSDHRFKKGFGRFAEDYGGLKGGYVIYYDGNKYSEVASKIAYANGINVDASRNLLFVSSPRGFLVKVYNTKDDGSIDFIENIKCGTGVDNIELDLEGKLWIGGHPNLLSFSAYAKNKKPISPSEIITIDYRSKGDHTVQQIYVNDGSQMSACSVAAPFNDIVLVGNVKDSKILVLSNHQ